MNLTEIRRKQIRCIFLFVAAIGFGIQVAQVSIKYFSYRTYVQVHVQFPERAEHYNVALCINYPDLVDWDILRNSSAIPDNSTFVFSQPKLTVRQVFDLTPGTEDAIDSCTYRINDWRLKLIEGRQCYDYFNVSKYVTQGYICYKFAPTVKPEINMRRITRSLSGQFAMNTVALNKNFGKTTNLNVISFHGSYPYLSRDASVSTYLLDSYLSKNRLFNYFDIFSNDYEFISLKAPYDTYCVDRDVEDIFTCKHACFIKHYTKIGKIAPMDPITVPLDLEIIDGNDLNNDEVLHNVSQIDMICRERCEFVACQKGYTKTTLLLRLIRHLNLGYYSRTPIEPSIVSEAIPVNSFVEYFSFTAGCFGIWFGISFLSLNPFNGKKNKPCTKSCKPFNVYVVNPSEKVASILKS